MNSAQVHATFFFSSCAVSGTSNVCRSSADCPVNASCEPRSGLDGQCVCRSGYFMKASGKTRACIQIADYGELCYLNQQCEFRLGTFSECKNSQCSCKDGSHYIVSENACVKSSSKISLLESQGLLRRVRVNFSEQVFVHPKVRLEIVCRLNKDRLVLQEFLAFYVYTFSFS